MRKTLIICLVFCIVMSIAVVSASALANSGGGTWQYQKEITIHENSGKLLTDYQVLVVLSGDDFPTEAQPDGGDIRFTADDGTELNYWIEEYDHGGKRAKIWVKLLEITAGRDAKIMMYYGNPNASSSSDGDAVFEFFDDFFGESLDTDKWQINANDYSVLNSKLRINVGAVSIADPLAFNFNDGYVLEGKVMYHNVNPRYSGSLSAQSSHYTQIQNDGADAINLYKRISRDLSRWTANGSASSYNCGAERFFESKDNVWYILGAKFHPGGVTLTENRKQEWLCGCGWVKNINYISLGAFHGSASYDIQDTSYDWILVRKYASPKPTISVGEEQSTIKAPSLTLSKSAIPSPILESEATTITIEVENKGSADAKNIVVKDTSASEFTLVSGSMTQSYDILKPNERRTYQYTIKATENGRFVTDVASATYEDEKGNSYSCASNSVPITVDPRPIPTPPTPPTPIPTPTPPIEKPQLTISHTTLIEPKIGEETLITVSIANTGNGEAKNIKLRERIPSGLSIDYVDGADSTGNLVSWDGDLKPTQTHSVKHSIKVLTAGDKIIPVEVTYEDIAGEVDVTSSTSSTIVIRPVTPAPTHTPTVTPTPTPTEESEPATIPWLYIIILVAVVLGGIAIIVAVRRKGEGGAEVTIEENTK